MKGDRLAAQQPTYAHGRQQGGLLPSPTASSHLPSWRGWRAARRPAPQLGQVRVL
jgi:hypothetical protein